MTGSALTFEQVSVRYDPHAEAVIQAISLSVEGGERVALVGLNGSGKTTLLMSAVGLVSHEGTICVSGTELSAKTLSQVRDRVGFLFNVPEDQLLFPKVTDDVAFGLIRRGVGASEAHSRSRETLAMLGIGDTLDSPLHHLSHGQKQRVALAGTLVTEPSLLLLDEPSAGLDPPGKRNLAHLLASLGAAMLVASHDFEFVSRFCTRFILLERGRIAFDGRDGREVLERWGMIDAG